MSDITLRLLGPPEISAGAMPVRFPRRQPLALLALLALSAAPVPREQLMLVLFGDQQQRVARERLRRVLHGLRRSLTLHGVDAGLLRTDGDVIALDRERCDIDVRRFEAGARAAAPSETVMQLYRGPLLHGLTLEAAAEWELWLAGERERLELLRLDLLARLSEQAATHGDWAAAATHAQALLASDALHESAHVSLMEAYAAQGKLGAVRRQYDTLRAVLRRELDIGPAPATQQRFDELMRGHRRVVAARPAQAPRPLDTLFGRDAQLLQIQTAFTQARTEQRVVCLLGPSGIGKTRLLEEALRCFAGGQAAVLRATCFPALQAVPYAALIDAFAGALPAEHIPLTPAALRTQDAPPDAAERRVWETLVATLSRLGTQHEQVVLVLDDFQWADERLLRALPYLLRRLPALPLLVALACRSEEQPAAVAATLRSLCAAPATTLIELQPLDRQAVSGIVSAWTGDAPLLSEALLQETEGNPFLLIETLRSLHEQGELRPHLLPDALPLPRAVRAAVEERIERLPAEARQVAETAALMGRELRIDVLRRATGRDEASLVDALERLMHAGILHEHNGSFGFTHGKLQAALGARLSGARRRLLHGRIARALARRSEAGTAALLLVHAQAAAEWELAYTAARRAALEARRLASFAQAASFEHAALAALERLPDGDERRAVALLALENDRHLLGQRAAQEAALERLEAIAVRGGITADVLYRRGRLYDAVGRSVEARPLLEQALAEAPDAELRTEIQLALARCLLHLGDDGAEAPARQALAEATGPGSAARRARAYLMLADLAYYRDDIASMQHWLRAAQTGARFGADAQARLRVMLARALFRSGDYQAALREAAQAFTAYAALGDLLEQAYCRLVQGAANGRLHRFAEAAGCYLEALAAFRALDHLRGEAGATLNLALQRTRVADYAAAGPLIESAYTLFERAGDPHGRCLAALNLSHHKTMLGQAASAEHWARVAIELAEQQDVPVHRSTAIANLAGALTAGGHYAQARELYTQVLDQASRDDLFTARVLSLSWLACTCMALGDLEAACRHSDVAVALSESRPGAADHPQVAYAARAFVLRRAGDEPGARTALAQAGRALEQLLASMPSSADRRCYEQHFATNRFIRAARRGDWESQHPLF